MSKPIKYILQHYKDLQIPDILGNSKILRCNYEYVMQRLNVSSQLYDESSKERLYYYFTVAHRLNSSIIQR
jgi:hypothetical protein